MDKVTKLVNNLSVDQAAEILVKAAELGRAHRKSKLYKQGEGDADLLSQAQQWISPASDYVKENLVEPVAGSYTGQAMKHIGYGLAGAGVGGLLGMGSQLFAPKKKRRYLSSALTGGLLGAAGGVGGSLLASNIGPAADTGKTPGEQAAATSASAKEMAENRKFTSPPAELLGKKWHISPTEAEALAQRRRINPSGVDEYLKAKTNNKSMIGIPKDVAKDYPQFRSEPGIALQQHALGDFAPDIMDADLGKSDARKELVKKLLTPRKGRTTEPFFFGNDPVDAELQHTKYDAKQLYNKLPGFQESVKGKNRDFYPLMQSGVTDEARKLILNRMLDETEQTGMMTPAEKRQNAWNKNPSYASLIGGGIKGLGHSPDSTKEEGLIPTLLRPGRQARLDDDTYENVSDYLKPYGIDTTELLGADSAGPRNMTAYKERLKGQQRSIPAFDNGPSWFDQSGRWTEEDINEQLPNILAKAKELGKVPTGDDNFINPDRLSTGQPYWDAALGAGAIDASTILAHRGLKNNLGWSSLYNHGDVMRGINEGSLFKSKTYAPYEGYLSHVANVEAGKPWLGSSKFLKDPNAYMNYDTVHKLENDIYQAENGLKNTLRKPRTPATAKDIAYWEEQLTMMKKQLKDLNPSVNTYGATQSQGKQIGGALADLGKELTPNVTHEAGMATRALEYFKKPVTFTGADGAIVSAINNSTASELENAITHAQNVIAKDPNATVVIGGRGIRPGGKTVNVGDFLRHIHTAEADAITTHLGGLIAAGKGTNPILTGLSNLKPGQLLPILRRASTHPEEMITLPGSKLAPFKGKAALVALENAGWGARSKWLGKIIPTLAKSWWRAPLYAGAIGVPSLYERSQPHHSEILKIRQGARPRTGNETNYLAPQE